MFKKSPNVVVDHAESFSPPKTCKNNRETLFFQRATGSVFFFFGILLTDWPENAS